MTHIGQLGTSYFLIDDNQRFKLTYPQYQALMELDQGAITEEELPERIKYHEERQQPIKCPLCEGCLPLGTVEFLEQMGEEDREQYHQRLYHRTSAPIPFKGEAMYPNIITEADEYF